MRMRKTAKFGQGNLKQACLSNTDLFILLETDKFLNRSPFGRDGGETGVMEIF